MPHEPTLDLIEVTIDRLIFKMDDPIVLAILGGWGEGKTYFWKNRIMPKYASYRTGYVSVFGADSLGAIRERVLIAAGETIDINERSISDMVMDKYPWLRHVGSAMSGIAKRWTSKLGVPDSIIDQLMENALLRDNWILCLDDVERLSDEIGTDTFLGYVNELREEHKLKVVLIFDEGWFENRNDKSFRLYREKIIDREVPFVQDLNDIVRLVANKGNEPDKAWCDELVKRCNVLDLRNIRVLGKAMRYFEELKVALPSNPIGAFCDSALHSLLLFSWIKFAPNKPVTFDDLEGYTVLGRSMARQARASRGEEEEEDHVEKLLSEYGYQMTDDLDLILIRFVQDGILDTVALLEEYDRYQNKTSRGLLENQFREAWTTYFHSTLRDNEDEFCEKLVDATEKNLQYISVEQLDSVLNVLEKLGRNEKAVEILNAFLTNRPNFYMEHQERSSFVEPLCYGPMKAAIEEAANDDQRDERSLIEVLKNAWNDDFISDVDRKRLSGFSGEDIANVLLNIDEHKLTAKLRSLCRMSRQASGDDDRAIASSLADAVEIIASKSTINRLRMEAMQLIKREDYENDKTDPSLNPPPPNTD